MIFVAIDMVGSVEGRREDRLFYDNDLEVMDEQVVF